MIAPRSPLGIIDLGRARFKASTWKWGPSAELQWSESVEVGADIDSSEVGKVNSALRHLSERVGVRAETTVLYGCSLLRDPHWLGELRGSIIDTENICFVLSPGEEGELLYRSGVKSISGSATTPLSMLDVGGGSVQLITSEIDGNIAEISSWGLGTFSVERRFDLPQGSPIERYEKAADAITKDVDVKNVETLIVGSGVMATFMRRLAPSIRAPFGSAWKAEDLYHAWRYCAEADSKEFAEIFPEKPQFMFGADKAMLVAWIFALKLGVSAVWGSDGSVSEGFALSAFDLLQAGKTLREMHLRSVVS